MAGALLPTRIHRPILILLTLAAWYAVPRGAFQFDDHSSALWASDAEWRIRPLLALTFSADRALYGRSAAGFLTENLVLHGLTVLVVYGLARRILQPGAALLAGAAFALQPSHAEVVAYVSGRSTGLASLLLLTALWAWTAAHDARTAWSSRCGFVLSLALFVAAALVKEMALVFPLLLLVWDAFAERRTQPFRRMLPVLATALALALCLAAIPRYRTLAAWSLERKSPLQALTVNVSALPFQVSLWARPDMLSMEHPLDASTLPLGVALAVLAGVVIVAVALRRKEPNVALAVAWAGAALAPTQSLLMKADVVTEKPLYLAWVGVAILIGALLARALERLQQPAWARGALYAGIAALALSAGAAVQHRVHIWSDPVLLWRDATTKAPQSSRAWNNLGNALGIDAPGEAAAALRRSVSLDPSNTYAWSNLANLEALCSTGCSPR